MSLLPESHCQLCGIRIGELGHDPTCPGELAADPPVLWLSLPDDPEEQDAPLIEALESGDAWTADMSQAARLARMGYTVKRRDRHQSGHLVDTVLSADVLDLAIGRGMEMRGLPELNRPQACPVPANQPDHASRVPEDVDSMERRHRFAAEFESWAKATREDFAKIQPPPRIPIYNPQIHPVREAEWNREWGNWLWPKAVKWWADRGYKLKGRDDQWHVETNDRTLATQPAKEDSDC